MRRPNPLSFGPKTSALSRVPIFESLETRQLCAAPTDLDLSFSGDGKVVTDLGSDDAAHAVAVQSDGKIVVAGSTLLTVNGSKRTAFAAVRYNKDGTLDDGSASDTTPGDKFATGGKFIRVLDLGGNSGAVAVTIQKDGKIILGGNANTASGVQWEFLRLNKDGSVDSGYGVGGKATSNFVTDPNNRFTAMTLQGDKLITVGRMEGDWVVRRLTSGGQWDSSFGTQGIRSFDFGNQVQIPTAVTIDRFGGIVIAGDAKAAEVAVVRLLSEGADDLSFGPAGRRTYKTDLLSAHVGALVVQPSGNIFLGFAGTYQIKAGIFGFRGGVAAFDDNGTFIGISTVGGRNLVNGVVNTPLDFLAVGATSVNGGATYSFSLANAFSDNEKFVGFGSSSLDQNVSQAMALTPDGKIVQVGAFSAQGNSNFAVVRYVGTPTANLATIKGNVFYDADRDGVRDANEGPASKTRIYIDANNNGLFDPADERSVLADNSGNYSFKVPAGIYRIRQDTTFPRSSTYEPAGPITVAANQTKSNVNFANYFFTPQKPGTRINGSVFFDFDGDGLRDVRSPNTEPDLVGRTVFLDTNGNGKLDAGEPRTTTDGGGNYSFENLTPGNYRVGTVLPTDWTFTDPYSGFHDVYVSSGQTITRRFATTFADPDDTVSEVNQRPSNQVAVGGSVNFTISNVTDVDFVRFTVKAGQRIAFDIDRAAGSSLNSHLRLFNAFGNLLASNDDAAAPGEVKGADSYLTYTFTTAGTCYIAMSNSANKGYDPLQGDGDNGAGTTGAYKLTLTSVPTASAAATATFSHVKLAATIDPSETEREEKSEVCA